MGRGEKRNTNSPAMAAFANAATTSLTLLNTFLLSHARHVSQKIWYRRLRFRPKNRAAFGVHFRPPDLCPPTVGGHRLRGLFLIQTWPPFRGRLLDGPKRGSVFIVAIVFFPFPPLPCPPLPPSLPSSHLSSRALISPHLTSPHLTLPHLTSSDLTSPHLS